MTDVAGYRVGMITRRTRHDTGPDETGRRRYTIQRVLSPADESLDLDEDQERWALEAMRARYRSDPKTLGKEVKVASGEALRRLRRPGQALLLLYVLDPTTALVDRPLVGWALSFPCR